MIDISNVKRKQVLFSFFYETIKLFDLIANKKGTTRTLLINLVLLERIEFKKDEIIELIVDENEIAKDLINNIASKGNE